MLEVLMKEFQHGVVKKEPTIGGTLPRMQISRSFEQTKRHQLLGYFSTNIRTDKQMIEFKCHECSKQTLPTVRDLPIDRLPIPTTSSPSILA
jgi:hypothetical protein